MNMICNACKEEKEISCFPLDHRKTCKKCLNDKKREVYKIQMSNPLLRKKKNETRRIARVLSRKKLDEQINKIKIDKGCNICGHKAFASSLLFHHLDPSEKEDKIANMRGTGTISKLDDIIKEIDKCVVLCFNCHIALHEGFISLSNPTADICHD